MVGPMEDVVAIVITDAEGVEHGVLTWGRTFGNVVYDELVEAVRARISGFGISPDGASLRVACTLQEVAAMPHFHECLFDMQTTRLDAVTDDASLRDGRTWLAHCRERILGGRDIWYLGDPQTTDYPEST